jgi:hypothetical protein
VVIIIDLSRVIHGRHVYNMNRWWNQQTVLNQLTGTSPERHTILSHIIHTTPIRSIRNIGRSRKKHMLTAHLQRLSKLSVANRIMGFVVHHQVNRQIQQPITGLICTANQENIHPSQHRQSHASEDLSGIGRVKNADSTHTTTTEDLVHPPLVSSAGIEIDQIQHQTFTGQRLNVLPQQLETQQNAGGQNNDRLHD